VGAAGGCARRRAYGHRARSARARAVLEAIGGYDKKTQSCDVAGVMDALSVPRADSLRMTSATWLATPSPLDNLTWSLGSCRSTHRFPGVGPWEQLIHDPRLWQLGFGGRDVQMARAGLTWSQPFGNDCTNPSRVVNAERPSRKTCNVHLLLMISFGQDGSIGRPG
jgi:hypothetical protein